MLPQPNNRRPSSFGVVGSEAEATDRGASERSKVNTRAEELAYVIDILQDHRRALKREAPRDDRCISWQAERLKHLRTEDATITNFNPFAELLMVREDLSRRFRVRVICGLELEFAHAEAHEERR